MSASAQPEPENKCPDCLFMQLTGEPLDSKQWFQQQRVLEKIELKITLNFNEQWQELPKGRVKFGIRGGELRLTLTNGKIPYPDRKWNKKFDPSIPRKRQTKISQKEKGSGKASASSSGDVKAELTGDSENISETIDTFPVSTAQVTTKGSEEEPVWAFEALTGEPILKENLTQEKLATVTVEKMPCEIRATFEVAERDLYFSDAEGVWPSNISRNKRASIERLLVRWLLKSKLQPYLSRQRLRYE